jgi:hypothetical protein
MPQISKERSQSLGAKFTREEEAIIREEATSQGMTVSEYVRAGVFMSLVLDGNTKAMKLMGGMIASKLALRFKAIAGQAVPA